MNLSEDRNSAVNNLLQHSSAGDRANIFITYAHEDAPRVLPWVSELENAGLCVQHDRGMRGSQQRLADVIDGCVGMVYVTSPQSIASPICHKEMLYAIRAGKVVTFTPLEKLDGVRGGHYANA